MKAFTIDRSKWLRGEGDGDSALLRPRDGKMCCLGFYLESCGLTPAQLEGRDAPSEVVNAPESAEWLYDSAGALRLQHKRVQSDVCMQLMDINDSESEDAEDREAFITKAFAEQGIKVTFVNGASQ